MTSLAQVTGTQVLLRQTVCFIAKAIGKRKLHQDERYMVFKRVTDSIVHQGHGSALFFVLEQVMGFCSLPAHRPMLQSKGVGVGWVSCHFLICVASFD